MNSRQKGKRGERLWRDELRAAGFSARRGQQFSGSTDSPDVVCAELGWIHFEVKAVERLNIEEAMDQARTDCGSGSAECGVLKVPVVAHKRSRRAWLVTMEAEVFFRLVRNHELTRMDTKPGSGLPKARSEITPEAWAQQENQDRQQAAGSTLKISAAASAAANSSEPKLRY